MDMVPERPPVSIPGSPFPPTIRFSSTEAVRLLLPQVEQLRNLEVGITITVQIDCSVPIENRSWSAMKAAFR